MNVSTLHKALGKLVEAGHGRKPVAINKETFSHPLEQDGAVIINVTAIDGPQWIPRIDDDGGYATNKDGSESGHYVVVLLGDSSLRA